jgi:hypothetical protein
MRASPRATQLLPLLLSLLLPRATCVAAAPLLNKGGGDCKRLVSAWLHAHDDDLVAGRTAAPAVRAPSLPPMASLTRPRHPPPPTHCRTLHDGATRLRRAHARYGAVG